MNFNNQPNQEQRPLGASHVQGGWFSKLISKASVLLPSPLDRQECSGSPAHQPSSLRCDRYAAMGLIPFWELLNLNSEILTGFLGLLSVTFLGFFVYYLTLGCKQESGESLSHASQEAISVTTLEITQEVENVQKKVKELQKQAVDLHRQFEINHKKASLERQFSSVSDEAIASDTITRLQRLADEVREFTTSKKTYQLNQVVEIAVDEIRSFSQSEFCRPLPEDVFETLETGIKTLSASLEVTLQSVNKLRSVGKLDTNTNEKQLKIWAINLELLAEEIENNLPFISPEMFDNLEKFFESIVLRSQRKESNARTKKESYRRRLRFAAGFVLNLIEMERDEALEEDKVVLQIMQSLSHRTLNAIHREDDEPWNPQHLDIDNKNI